MDESELRETLKSRIKCYTCMRPSSTCICKFISPFQTKTRFIILMHPKDYKKERNGTSLDRNNQYGFHITYLN